MHIQPPRSSFAALAACVALGACGHQPEHVAADAHADPDGAVATEHGSHHGHHGHHGHHDRRFQSAEAWAARFDSPERDAWQRGDEVVEALVTSDGLRVVDIGAGTGYFAVRFARAVPKGVVVGIDIEPTMVDYLTKRAKEEGLTNLTARLADGDDPKLGDLGFPVDLVFLSNTYHHIANRVGYFRGVRDHLAPGGRLAIVDFRVDSRHGPPREHKIPPAAVEAELREAGWKLVDTHDFLPEQYILVFEPAD